LVYISPSNQGDRGQGKTSPYMLPRIQNSKKIINLESTSPVYIPCPKVKTVTNPAVGQKRIECKQLDGACELAPYSHAFPSKNTLMASKSRQNRHQGLMPQFFSLFNATNCSRQYFRGGGAMG